MSIFTSFNVNASGMTAQRYRMEIGRASCRERVSAYV